MTRETIVLFAVLFAIPGFIIGLAVGGIVDVIFRCLTKKKLEPSLSTISFEEKELASFGIEVPIEYSEFHDLDILVLENEVRHRIKQQLISEAENILGSMFELSISDDQKTMTKIFRATAIFVKPPYNT